MKLLPKLTNRLSLIEQAKVNIELASYIYRACQEDIFYWIDNFCWTHDPRKVPSQIPIDLYPFQRNIIRWILKNIKEKKDGLIEKSRDMGISWMFIYVFQWLWQFGASGNDFIVGSRKEEFVDRLGNIDTLFEKIRYNLYRQPIFLLPHGFDRKQHDNYMRLLNPHTGSFIKGEACNQYFGTGGRYKAALLDEFAKWDHKDESAWNSLGDATKCRFPISSANGKNNHFYKLRAKKIGNIEKKTIHWKVHPEKNQLWYQTEKKRRSPSELAAEVDIDYSASVTDKAFESFNQSIHVSTNGKFQYDPQLPLELNCDFNINPMCWNVSQVFGAYSWTFKAYTEYTALTENCITKFVNDFKDHKMKTVYVYGDPSGKAGSTRSRLSDYDIIKQVLQKHRWNVILQIDRGAPSQVDRMNAANKRLCDWEMDNKAFEFIDESCVDVIESIEQTKRKDDGIDKDGSEHHSDAWSYRIVKKYPVIKKEFGSVNY